MSDTSFNAGQNFQNFLTAAPIALNPVTAAAMGVGNAAVHVGNAVASGFPDFMRGLIGTSRPTVTVKLPDATPAPAGAGPKTPTGAAPKTPAANTGAPAAQAGPTPDDMKALGNLSFRQLMALGKFAGDTKPNPNLTKVPTAADQAGSMLADVYKTQFTKSLAQAGKDPVAQQKALDAFEQKMLPIALRGNTADAAIFDSNAAGIPGAQ